jgi:hypothetical protein
MAISTSTSMWCGIRCGWPCPNYWRNWANHDEAGRWHACGLC